MKTYNVGVFGATGAVGHALLQVLADRNFPIKNLYVYASTKSDGSTIQFKGETVTVRDIDKAEFGALDFALFATSNAVSKKYIPKAVAAGGIAIDNSSAFRYDDDKPLIVPEVNMHRLSDDDKIIASPNCSTIQLTVALAPIHKAIGIKKVVVSTYQAVSGSGMPGINQLRTERAGGMPENPAYPKPIVNNCLPHIGSFAENGYSGEEEKMIVELRKIMNAPEIIVAPTTVRVPVEVGHSESVLLELSRPAEVEEIRTILAGGENIILMDSPSENNYPTANIAAGTDEVYVGRIRRVAGWENAIQLWVVADNVRKGAATNVIQIAEKLIGNKRAVAE